MTTEHSCGVWRWLRHRVLGRYLTTVGVKIDRKIAELPNRTVNLILWDLAGKDDIASLRVSYLRGAAGYVLVAEGTRHATLDVALSLRQRGETDYGALPFALLLNKAELKEDWNIDDAETARLQQDGWWVCLRSARSGEGPPGRWAAGPWSSS